MASFPSSLPVLTNPGAANPMNGPSHSAQHGTVNDEVEAIAAKVGVDNSAVTSSFDYRIRTLEASGGGGAGVSRAPASYFLYKEGANYKAFNGLTGAVDYSGTSASAVVGSVLAALGTGGGEVVLDGRSSWAWDGVPRVPVNLTGKLLVRMTAGSRIILSNAGSRFLDFADAVAGDFLRNVELRDVRLDASALTSASGSGHYWIGTWRGTSGAQVRVNIDNVVIRRCSVKGGLVSNDAWHVGAVFATAQNANGQPQNTITNILVEDCDLDGGQFGITVRGEQTGAATSTNIWADNIEIRNFTHTLRTAPTAFQYSAHVHIGDAAKVGRVLIDGLVGYGSKDVGIEVDQVDDVTIQNVEITDCFGQYVYAINFMTPNALSEQTLRVINVVGRRTPGAKYDNGATSMIRVRDNGFPYGTTLVRNCRWYNNQPDMTKDGQQLGAGVWVNGTHRNVIVDGFEYVHEGINYTDTAAASYVGLLFQMANASPVTLRNVRWRLDGARASGSGDIDTSIIKVSGSAILDADNLTGYGQITGISTGYLVGITIDGSAIRGTVRRYSPAFGASASTPSAFYFPGSCTIDTMFVVDDSDFRGMLSGNEFSYSGSFPAAEKGKILHRNVRYRTSQPQPETMTVGTSPWVHHNVTGRPCSIAIRGGTVSSAEVSPDGTNYWQVAAATGVIVPLNQGDRLRVTYSVIPAAVFLPSR